MSHTMELLRAAPCRLLAGRTLLTWALLGLLACALLGSFSGSAGAQGRPDIEWMAGGHWRIIKVVVDPLGRFIVAGPEGTRGSPLGIWGMDGTLQRSLNIVCESRTAAALAISNNGQICALAGPSWTIELRRTDDWTLLRSISLGVEQAVFSRDDQYLLAANGYGLHFIRVADGVVSRTITWSGAQCSFSGIDIDQSGRYVALANKCGWSGGGVKLVDLTAGTFQEIPRPSNTGAVYAVAFSRDGRLASIHNEFDNYARVRFWGVPGGQPAGVISDGWYNSGFVCEPGSGLAFSPDGQRVAVAGRRIGVWDVTTGQRIGSRPLAAAEYCIALSLAYTPDGNLLVAGDDFDLLSPDLSSLIVRFTGHRSAVYGHAVSGNGEILASADIDGNGLAPQIVLRRTSDGAFLRRFNGMGPWGAVYSVALSPNGETVVSGGSDGLIRVWQVSDGTLRYSISGAHGGAVHVVAMSPTGQVFATGGKNNFLKVWRLSDGALLFSREVHPGYSYSLYGLEFSPDGQVLAAGGDGEVTLWQVTDAGLVALRTLPSTDGAPRDLAFSPDGSVLVVARAASFGGTSGLRAYSVASGATLRSTVTSLPAEGVAVSCDGRTVASVHGLIDYSGSLWWGGYDRRNDLNLWRMSDFSRLRTYNEEIGWWAIKSVAFTPNGRSFTYARHDGTIVMARNPYPPVGDVAGTVTADGAPLAGVTVELAASDGYSDADVSGTDGSYGFSDVPFGPATVSVVVPTGYLAVDPPSGSADVAVTAGQTATQDFVLSGCGSITGVVAGDGAPMAGVVVTVSGTGGYAASTSSGPGGAYAFDGVPSGPATVSIAPPTGYMVLDPSGGSAVIQVIPGQTAQRDFALAHMQAAVGGAVVADCPAAGTPVESIAAEVRDAATNDLAGTALTGSDGHYTVPDLGAGAYVVSITVPPAYNLQSNHVPVVVDWGETGTVNFALCCQRPPVVAANQDTVSVNEGETATNSGAVSDPDSDPVTLTASVGTVTKNGDGTWNWSFLVVDGPALSQTVTITGNDGRGGITTASFQLVAVNVAPTVMAIALPIDPIDINEQPVGASATFADLAGTADEPFTCRFDFGDGSGPAAGAVNGTTCTSPGHSYSSAGVYTVTLSVTDKDGGVGSATSTSYIVIYDPSAGFVTGGGWIESPPGAYQADPDLAGRANFGFISKYRRGLSQPDGNTEFQFHAGGLNFHSTSYDWLVVAGPHAKYKGSGRINNAGDYGFMLTATDAEVNGGGVVDLFRIKIWMKDANETVVYDNQMGEDDSGYAGTAIGGGQIRIHSDGQAKGEDPSIAGDVVIPTRYALHGSVPNPFNPVTEILFDLPEAATVKLVVYDTMGRVVARLVDGSLPPGQHRAAFEGTGLPSGRYYYRLDAGSFSATRSMTLMK